MSIQNQPGFPDNWSGMSPEQKRRWRLDYFLNGEGIRFVSPEAKRAYCVRAQRLVDTYNLQEPDRVPISLPVGDLPYLLNGINIHTAMYDIRKAAEACQKFNERYAEELEYFATPQAIPAKILDILDYRLYVWPGHGLSVDAPGYQFVEGEYMKPEEYADLIRDPTDFWLRVYLPRLFGAFEGFRAISPLTNIIEMAASQLTVLRDPKLRMALRKMLEAGDELEKRMEISEKYAGLGPANGYPSTFGGLSKAPFDILGDALRGTTAIMKDLYRRPDKVLEAVEIIADITINNITTAPNFSRIFNIMLPLHKGADGWMSQKQFETFYFPTLKKVMDALIKEGMIVTLFAEGSYNTRLESINVFPKGSVCWYFDQTDMVRAKKILGDKCCIQGNVPSSLIVTGSPVDVKENCRKLIEGCAPGGGYILGAGCMAENPKLDNLRAMIAAVKEYGVYKK